MVEMIICFVSLSFLMIQGTQHRILPLSWFVQTQKLSDPSISNEEIMKSGNRLSEVVIKLEAVTDRWLELSEYV